MNTPLYINDNISSITPVIIILIVVGSIITLGLILLIVYQSKSCRNKEKPSFMHFGSVIVAIITQAGLQAPAIAVVYFLDITNELPSFFVFFVFCTYVNSGNIRCF
ncbi:MAG: hypothetical protein FWE13_01840 [Firmicutes bacterium]|nr:hypothetical protein [Bacillota bacterium]